MVPPEPSRPRAVVAGAVALVVAIGIAACASTSAPPKPHDAQLAVGWQVYNDHCATCHGSTGEGGAGPKLAGRVVDDFPNIGDQIAVIEHGKGGGAMPAWQGRLTAQQIEDVARYTRTCLGSTTC